MRKFLIFAILLLGFAPIAEAQCGGGLFGKMKARRAMAALAGSCMSESYSHMAAYSSEVACSLPQTPAMFQAPATPQSNVGFVPPFWYLHRPPTPAPRLAIYRGHRFVPPHSPPIAYEPPRMFLIRR